MDSVEAKRFEEASREVASYFKQGLVEPPHITRKFKMCLERYKNYLDKKGIFMPPARYIFDNKDKSTWKYLDCIIREKDGSAFFRGEVLNPNFKFK